MQRWQLSLGLAGTAVMAALLAPRLFPLLGVPTAEPLPEPLPTAVVAEVPTSEVPSTPAKPRTIDLVIAIDTSGSMERLIDSTRARLWDIVNDIDAKDPDAILRVGLLAYGTPQYGEETGYVRVVMPLTEDLDELYTRAWELKTDGGDEYVGAVIGRAVRDLDWAPADNDANRRLLFIAGNETAALGPVSYYSATAAAREAGVRVSTLFAGSDPAGRSLQWDRVAQLGGGAYLAIDATQSAVAVDTPYDRELARLNEQLNKTYVAGSASGAGKLAQMLDNDVSSGSYGLGGLASRAASKGSKKFKTDGWDLVEQLANGDLDPSAVDKAALPVELRDLNGVELTQELEKKRQQREATKTAINRVQASRSGFLAEKAQAEAGEGMDEAMSGILSDLL